MKVVSNSQICDVTFIVIARDGAFAAKKCLHSIASMQVENCEVICVDSGSIDNTPAIMSEYAMRSKAWSVYRCQGYSNSAIARNVGIRHATKEFIFFVDGDIEIATTFVIAALEYIRNGKADAVTGQLSELYYSENFEEITKEVNDRFGITQCRQIHSSGGCFITRRSVINTLGYWDERLERNQDLDYTLRLSRNYCFLSIPVNMGTHHTLGYSNRIAKFVLRLYPVFWGMVLRKNLDRPRVLLKLFTQHSGFLWGIIFYIFFIFLFSLSTLGSLTLYKVIIVMAFILGLDVIYGLFRRQNVLERFLSHYIYAPLVVLGIFHDFDLRKGDSTIARVI